MEQSNISVDDFKDGIKSIDSVDAKGLPIKYLLLHDNRIATVREGKGVDIERSTIESSDDKSKYLSSLMAACTKIDGQAITMYDLSNMKMKDYTAIQLAFADINF